MDENEYIKQNKDIVVPRVMKKFVTAKGKAYYTYMGVLQKYLADDLKKAIAEKREESESGLISYADMCHLLVMFQFPSNRMKSLFEICQNLWLIRQEPYSRYKHLGVKASLDKLGYEKCPNPDCWRWHNGHCPECEPESAADALKRHCAVCYHEHADCVCDESDTQ